MQQQQTAEKPRFVQVGEEFAQHYYNCFDTDRTRLADLYADKSLLTFEGAQVMGKQAIMEKIQKLSYQVVRHIITTCDCQPIFDAGEAILVTIMGQLKTDNDPAKGFVQSFVLRASPEGAFYVANETFRLVVHDG